MLIFLLLVIHLFVLPSFLYLVFYSSLRIGILYVTGKVKEKEYKEENIDRHTAGLAKPKPLLSILTSSYNHIHYLISQASQINLR